MKLLLRIGCLMATILIPSGLIYGQDPDSETAQTANEFVSGVVTELSQGRIVVNRAVPGKPPENRSFAMTAETKVEGRLRVGARVTVGFRNTEGEPVAVRIIVRPQNERRP